jgi:hypothetical protein
VNDALLPAYRTKIGIPQTSGGDSFALQQKMQNLLQPQQLCTICTGIPLWKNWVWSQDCTDIKTLYLNKLYKFEESLLRHRAAVVNPVFNIVFAIQPWIEGAAAKVGIRHRQPDIGLPSALAKIERVRALSSPHRRFLKRTKIQISISVETVSTAEKWKRQGYTSFSRS